MRTQTRRRRSRAKRERITIRQRSYTKDAVGQKVLDTETVVLEQAPAWYEYTGGLETFRGQQLEAHVSGVFEVRDPRIDLTTEMYLVHENDGQKEYEIVAVKPSEAPHEGGFREIWIFVKAYANV